MSRTALYLGVTGVLALLGGGGFFYMAAQQSTLPSDASKVASITPEVATTSTATTTYDGYAETITQKVIEKEYGIPVKGVAEKPTPQNVAGKKWVLTVSVNSLSGDLALTESPGETHWMDQVRFDSELTAFETKEKASLADSTASWSTIIGRDDLAQQMIVEIQNTYSPIWQKKLDDLTKIQNAGNDITTLFTSRWSPMCRQSIVMLLNTIWI
jgi:hypothetical protein